MALTLVCAPVLAAQTPSPAQIAFLGFQPGTSRTAFEAEVRARGGRLSCTRSTADPRFGECRGALPTPDGTLTLTGSLVRDSVAILLFAAAVPDDLLSRWIDEIAAHYGPVEPRHHTPSTMWQWVRRGRMLRITTRLERGTRMVSASLVHGPLLDGLGSSPP